MEALEAIVFAGAVLIVIFTVSYNLKRLLRGEKCSGCNCGKCTLACGSGTRKQKRKKS